MMIAGSSSMPTETKNNTVKMSVSGRMSAAARSLTRDSASTTPARKAPKASETSKITAEANAIPIAVAMTARVKSSRDPSPSTRVKSHGSTREPTTSINPVSSAALPRAAPTWITMLRDVGLPSAPDVVARIGSSTNATTVNRSSTINQPIATLPASVSSVPRCRRARINTTVLATEIARPRTTDERTLHPKATPASAPSVVAIAICTTAPGTANR